MVAAKKIISRPGALKKFYFFEYFYIFLECIEKYGHIDNEDKIFSEFNLLKQKYLLGESKYKKLSFEKESETRFVYTIRQVGSESLAYGLIELQEDKLILTSKGHLLLDIFRQQDPQNYYNYIAQLMEDKYAALHHLIRFCYKANHKKHGLLIFPTYSPPKLGIDKKDIVFNYHIDDYISLLTSKIEKDIFKFLELNLSLSEQELILRVNLEKANMLSVYRKDTFNHNIYNALVRRIRDYWVNYFLKELYKYEFSLSIFDICTYRAKQIGVLNATEFYPKFDGKIIYPTSVILKNSTSNDFESVVSYINGETLYMHNPKVSDENNMELFVKSLTEAYIDIKSRTKTYFVNLLDVREIVCYGLRISERIFNNYLNDTYKLNLLNKLQIGISLESDKLPQETSAMYLKREPILIDGKYKNIVAIDLSSRR